LSQASSEFETTTTAATATVASGGIVGGDTASTSSTLSSSVTPATDIASNASVDIDSASGPPFWAWIILALLLVLCLAGVAAVLVWRRKQSTVATASEPSADVDSTTSSHRTQIYGDASNLSRPAVYSAAEFVD
jgi:hypothetical protein